MNRAQSLFFAFCVAWAGIGATFFLIGLDLYLEEGKSINAFAAMVGGFICPPHSLFSFVLFRNRFVRT